MHICACVDACQCVTQRVVPHSTLSQANKASIFQSGLDLSPLSSKTPALHPEALLSLFISLK